MNTAFRSQFDAACGLALLAIRHSSVGKDDKEPDLNPAKEDVGSIQLVLAPEAYAVYAVMAGQYRTPIRPFSEPAANSDSHVQRKRIVGNFNDKMGIEPDAAPS
jgi:hypothetical protein